jgi:hypothetical protein
MTHEDDLRAAYRWLAGRAPGVETVLTAVLERPAEPISERRPRAGDLLTGRRRSRGPMLAPIAAAVAVVAVVAVAAAIGAGMPEGGPAASSAAALAGVPPSYLTLTPHGHALRPPFYAYLRSTVTGASLATVRPPAPFNSFIGVTGAADDRTFVLAAEYVGTGARAVEGPTALFRARFDPDTQKLALTRLPVPEFPATTFLPGLALSPSGAELAVSEDVLPAAAKGDVSQDKLQIAVFSMTTGAARIWRDAEGRGNSGFAGFIENATLSWAGDGILAFDYLGLKRSAGIRLLNTSGPGGDLLADSRQAVSMAANVSAQGDAWTFGGDLLTPDGGTIVAGMTWQPKEVMRNGVTVEPHWPSINAELAEYSVATGQRIRTFLPVHKPFLMPVWTNASGSVVIVYGPASRQSSLQSPLVLGVVTGSRFTRIPGGSGIDYGTAAPPTAF